VAGGAGGAGVVIVKYPSGNNLSVGAGLTAATSNNVSGFKVTTFNAGTGNVSWA
jgi:hypothetical protein